jgi:hypothetical protein
LRVHVSDNEAQQNAQLVYRRSWARRHRVPNIHWRQMLSTLWRSLHKRASALRTLLRRY